MTDPKKGADKPDGPTPPQDEDDRTQFAPSPGAGSDDTPATQPPAPSTPPPDRTQILSPEEVARLPGQTGAPVGPSDDESTRFADAPPDSTDAAIPPAPRPRRTETGPTVQIGTLINNNYEVKEVLKAGGMGEVYRGENVFTGDPVAIKVVLPELAEDEKAGLLFMREARTLSQLSDEAIVRYYNFVKDPVIDRFCLIMEFIQGVPLSDFTAQNGAVSKEAAEVLLKRLAKGLDKAHGRDVIHRDLSPDNVMLPDGIIAEALLIDFGIAKSNVVKESTMAGQFAGKFKYVSPEQLGHFGGHIGPATDIYGLALLIAAALLARPLDMGSSIVEAVQARQSIPDLSELPEDLRPLLSYMLEPDPADRPESMAEVARLVDYPEEVPYKYRVGLPPPTPRAQQTTSGFGRGTAAGMALAVPPMTVSGLQTPPMTGPGMGTTPPSGGSDSAKPEKGSGRGLLGLMAVVSLAVLAGAGFYAWTEGLIGPLDPALPDPTPAATVAESTGLPEIQSNTREGFLAGFDTGPCTFASRVSAGPNAGMVQGFGQRPEGFAGLPTAYQEQFGALPAILESPVTAEQCAVLDFAKGLQGRGLDPVTMQLEAGTVESGQSISGQITDALGRPVWLVLISPRGAVYNLTPRLSEPVGDRRSFRFGLSLAEGSDAAPQLLLAVAASQALATAAQAQDGAEAAVLLPLVMDEITRRGGQGSAALSHVLLTPPAPEPEAPEPEPDDTTDDG